MATGCVPNKQQDKSLNTLTHKVGQCILVFTCPLLPDCNIPVTAIIVANMGGKGKQGMLGF